MNRTLFMLIRKNLIVYSIFYNRNVVYSLDKEETSYDDLLDALRLNLKGYNIEKKERNELIYFCKIR
jgi:hypothetical protein